MNSQQLENNNISFPHQPYTIEFVFDSDCDCTIKILYFATESYRGLTSNDNNNSINGGGGKLTYMCGCAKFYSAVTNHMSDGSLNQSPCCCYESRSYKKGAGQVFKLDLEHSIIPSRYICNINIIYSITVLSFIITNKDTNRTHGNLTCTQTTFQS